MRGASRRCASSVPVPVAKDSVHRMSVTRWRHMISRATANRKQCSMCRRDHYEWASRSRCARQLET
ncbi:hypothetical protein BD413DRAFT_93060 [Trametes elegans]|nr:hypothetical protein BD413DRAFT_93060 [Trametes elegans]